MTTLFMKLPQNLTRVKALSTILSVMTSGVVEFVDTIQTPGNNSKRRIVHSRQPPPLRLVYSGYITGSKFEVLKHPLYTPDSTPPGFYLFGPLKEYLQGRKFTDDNEVICLNAFLLEDICKLVDRWTKCGAKQVLC